MREGRAAGVELAAGERIAARAFVASGLNPQQTFLDLLDAGAVPGPVRDAAGGFRYNRIAPLFALNLALRELPRYRAVEGRLRSLAARGGEVDGAQPFGTRRAVLMFLPRGFVSEA